jgi:hypothetical protein
LNNAVKICSVLAISSLVVSHSAFCGDYLSQLKPGDVEYDLAAEMQRHDCKMTEQKMFDFLMSRGVGLGGAQATIKNLAEAREIIWDKEESYTVVGWGNCK